MMEGLAKHSEREVRALNLDLAVQGLGAYGLGVLLTQLHAPASLVVPAVLVLTGAAAYRWVDRRRAAESLDENG